MAELHDSRESAALRRTDPLTEAECALFRDKSMFLRVLGKRFNCSETTMSRVRKSVLAGESPVCLFRTPGQSNGPKRIRPKNNLDAAAPENPLMLDPVGACNAHLEDLRRVYGRARL